MSSSDRAVHRIAARQFSCFSRSQAQACGLSNKQIRHRVETRQWTAIHPGSFRLAGTGASPQSTIAAAVLALPGSFVSYESAVFMWDGNEPPTNQPAISRLHGLGANLKGVHVHQTTQLPKHHVTRLGALPITTRARTAFDVAATLDHHHLGRLVDDQVVRGRLRIGQIERVFLDLACPGRTGTSRMARLLDERIGGYTPTESDLEARFATLCRLRGLPDGERQMTAPWQSATATAASRSRERVDLAYRAERLIVELDGRRYHAQLEAMARDRRRDQLALACGWSTLRFTWWQITKEPAFVAGIVRTVLGIDGPAGLTFPSRPDSQSA